MPCQKGSVPPDRIGYATTDTAIIVSAASPIAESIISLREKCGLLGKTCRVCLRVDWRGCELTAFDSTASSAAGVPSCAGMVLGPGCSITAALGRKRCGGVVCLHSCSSTVSFLPQPSQNLAPASNSLPQLLHNKAPAKWREPVDRAFELVMAKKVRALEESGQHSFAKEV